MIRGLIGIVMQYMANHLPNLENKLADSKAMRGLAKSLVHFGQNLKYFAEKDTKFLHDAPKMARRLSSEFAQTMRDAKSYFKK